MQKYLFLTLILSTFNLSHMDPNTVYSCDIIDRSRRAPNRCENINDVIVEERTYYQSNVRYWCIVLDNRANYYTGYTLEIQLAGNGYGVSFITATELPAQGFRVPFQMNSGVNRIAIYSYSGQHTFPRIRSIKLAGRDLCDQPLNTFNSEPVIENRLDYSNEEQSNDIRDGLATYITQNRESGERYRFLNDCIERRSTGKFTTWCSHLKIPSSVFMIERYNLNGEDYWCLNFERDKTRRNLNTLLIKFRGVSKSYSWIPAEAAINNDPRNTQTQNVFYIGNDPTTIEVSPYRRGIPIPEIESVTIDGRNVCDYYSPFAYNIDSSEPANDDDNIPITTDSFPLINDCIKKRDEITTTTWCSGKQVSVEDFSIEKFTTTNGQQYWCLNFEVDRMHRGAQPLTVGLNVGRWSYQWIPSQSHYENDSQNTNREKLFTIGEQPTTIVIKSLNQRDRLTNLDSVKINGQDICNYYAGLHVRTKPETDVSTSSPPRRTTATTKTTRPITRRTTKRTTTTTTTTTTSATIEPTTHKSLHMSSCGIAHADFNSRIAFGADAEEGTSPWHTAIFKNSKFICGGTLIKTNTILTAGHCLVDVDEVVKAEALMVKLGLYTLNRDSDYTQSFNVTQVILHINYNPDSYEHDIGMLRLQRNAEMTDNVGMACLPNKDYSFVGEVGQIVGWGENEHSQVQNILQTAYIPVVDRQECLESNRDHFGKRLYRSNFCAGNKNQTNVCRGDSGGGLVFNLNSYWTVGGLTSLAVAISNGSESICDLRQFVLYTDVSKYIDWIEEPHF